MKEPGTTSRTDCVRSNFFLGEPGEEGKGDQLAFTTVDNPQISCWEIIIHGRPSPDSTASRDSIPAILLYSTLFEL